MAVTKTLKDAAYITVGLGVIGFQRAQVRRQELTKQLNEQVSQTRGQVEKVAKDIEGRLKTDSWEDPQTKQKKYMTNVVATDLVLLGGRDGGSSGGDSSSRSSWIQ